LRVIRGWDAQLPHGCSTDREADARSAVAASGADALAAVLKPWQEKFPLTDVTPETVVGGADRHLLDAASNATLLVIGRRTRSSRYAPRTGSVAHAVLHHSRTPVAVVPHD
jgi:nucleotide-binding universal stress UspA family protein